GDELAGEGLPRTTGRDGVSQSHPAVGSAARPPALPGARPEDEAPTVAPMCPDLRAQLEETLSGSYSIERELGGGGMARVFVATETALARKVVIKVLSPELAAGVSQQRFAREIRLVASLQQANIVPVLSTGELPAERADEPPSRYYTMPFVDGLSLQDQLTAHGPLAVSEAIGVLRGFA